MTSLLTKVSSSSSCGTTLILLLPTSYPSVPTAPGCTGTSVVRLIAFRTATAHLIFGQMENGRSTTNKDSKPSLCSLKRGNADPWKQQSARLATFGNGG